MVMHSRKMEVLQATDPIRNIGRIEKVPKTTTEENMLKEAVVLCIYYCTFCTSGISKSLNTYGHEASAATTELRGLFQGRESR